MEFSEGKYKPLYLGKDNPMHQHRLGKNNWKAALPKKALGSWKIR